MSTLPVKICDRCGEILLGPHNQVGIAYHHPRFLDICNRCEAEFTIWLGKHPLWGTTIEQMKNGKYAGTGYPSQEMLKDLP